MLLNKNEVARRRIARGLTIVTAFEPPIHSRHDVVCLGTDTDATPRRHRRRRGTKLEFPVQYAVVSDDWELYDMYRDTIPKGSRSVTTSGWFARRV